MNEEFNNTGNPEEMYAKKNSNPKRRKIILSVLLVLLIIGSLVGVSFAKKLKDYRDKGPLGMMIEKMTEDLDLTADQKTQVDAIKAEIKAKMEAKKDSHKDMKGKMEELFRQPTLDKQKLLDLDAEKQASRTEMKSFMFDELIKFHDLLTDAQRNKVADKMKAFHEKHKDGMWHKGENKDGDKNKKYENN